MSGERQTLYDSRMDPQQKTFATVFRTPSNLPDAADSDSIERFGEEVIAKAG